jgi:CRISPR-associated exonuclease Cas4
MHHEDDLLAISALQHLLFCPRQCALIHLEGQWEENRFTAEGRIAHDKVHDAASERRGGLKTVTGLHLRSLRLGLTGVADVVEFERDAAGDARPFPVEHKRGRPKEENWDRVQLCAQALCLEEMTGASIPRGALYYGKNRRRVEVPIDEDLRRRTEDAARHLHELIASGRTPLPVYSKKCDACSLVARCLPRALSSAQSSPTSSSISPSGRSVENYLATAMDEL